MHFYQWAVNSTNQQLKIPFYPEEENAFWALEIVRWHILLQRKNLDGQRYLVGYHNLSYKDYVKISDVIGKKSMIALAKIAVRLLGHVGPYLHVWMNIALQDWTPMSFVRCNSQDTEMAPKWFKSWVFSQLL